MAVTSSFRDPFTSAPSTDVWEVWQPGGSGQVAASNGVLTIANAGGYPSVYTVRGLPFTLDSWGARVATFPPTGVSGVEAGLGVRDYNDQGATLQLFLYYDVGAGHWSVACRVIRGSDYGDSTYETLPSGHVCLRIRYDGTTTFWETAPAWAGPWTTLRSAVVGGTWTNCGAGLFGGNWNPDTAAQGASIGYADLNGPTVRATSGTATLRASATSTTSTTRSSSSSATVRAAASATRSTRRVWTATATVRALQTATRTTRRVRTGTATSRTLATSTTSTTRSSAGAALARLTGTSTTSTARAVAAAAVARLVGTSATSTTRAQAAAAAARLVGTSATSTARALTAEAVARLTASAAYSRAQARATAATAALRATASSTTSSTRVSTGTATARAAASSASSSRRTAARAAVLRLTGASTTSTRRAPQPTAPLRLLAEHVVEATRVAEVAARLRLLADAVVARVHADRDLRVTAELLDGQLLADVLTTWSCELLVGWQGQVEEGGRVIVGSREYLRCRVQVADVDGGVVDLSQVQASMRVGLDGSWQPAATAVSNGALIVSLLVGDGQAVDPGVGVHAVHVRVEGEVERPVVRAGSLYVAAS